MKTLTRKSNKNNDLNNTFCSSDVNDKGIQKVSEIELRMTKVETVLALLSNQNDLLIRKIEELEKEREKDKLYIKTIEKLSNDKSISTDINTFNDTVGQEFFNNSQNSFEIEDWKKDIEKNIEKITSDKNDKLITSIDFKFERNNVEFDNIKNFISEFQKKMIEQDKRFEKFSKIEKLISELINQLNVMKKNNTNWQADFLKNINDFNEKIMNQEILLDQFDVFEKNTNKKLDQLSAEMKMIPSFITKQKNEIYETIDIFENKLQEQEEKVFKNKNQLQMI